MKYFFIPFIFLFIVDIFSQSVDGGNGHSLILDREGNVYAIGRNNYGQLGDSTYINSSIPKLVSRLPKIKVISRGYDHSLAIDSSGNIWEWGRNNYGQLGTVLANDYNVPQKLKGHSNFKSVEGGHWHTVALKNDGTVWSWGHNYYGELGSGDREHSSFPVQVVKENGEKLTNIKAITCVGYHTLALDNDGNVFSWGGNEFGELGHFDNKIQPFAKKIKQLNSITDIAVGASFSST
ncbi:MAG: hypothetical protein R2771_10160 [Saprospiraceae bacterium]